MNESYILVHDSDRVEVRGIDSSNAQLHLGEVYGESRGDLNAETINDLIKDITGKHAVIIRVNTV